MTLVYPVPGLFLQTVPAAEHECSGKGDHAICTESGAFTDRPPKRAEPKQIEDPPDGGSLDSTEAGVADV